MTGSNLSVILGFSEAAVVIHCAGPSLPGAEVDVWRIPAHRGLPSEEVST